MINSQMAFYEIIGDEQVEKIKKQILRLMVTQQDLEMTDSVLKEIITLMSQGATINQIFNSICPRPGGLLGLGYFGGRGLAPVPLNRREEHMALQVKPRIHKDGRV